MSLLPVYEDDKVASDIEEVVDTDSEMSFNSDSCWCPDMSFDSEDDSPLRSTAYKETGFKTGAAGSGNIKEDTTYDPNRPVTISEFKLSGGGPAAVLISNRENVPTDIGIIGSGSGASISPEDPFMRSMCANKCVEAQNKLNQMLGGPPGLLSAKQNDYLEKKYANQQKKLPNTPVDKVVASTQFSQAETDAAFAKKHQELVDLAYDNKVWEYLCIENMSPAENAAYGYHLDKLAAYAPEPPVADEYDPAFVLGQYGEMWEDKMARKAAEKARKFAALSSCQKFLVFLRSFGLLFLITMCIQLVFLTFDGAYLNIHTVLPGQIGFECYHHLPFMSYIPIPFLYTIDCPPGAPFIVKLPVAYDGASLATVSIVLTDIHESIQIRADEHRKNTAVLLAEIKIDLNAVVATLDSASEEMAFVRSLVRSNARGDIDYCGVECTKHVAEYLMHHDFIVGGERGLLLQSLGELDQEMAAYSKFLSNVEEKLLRLTGGWKNATESVIDRKFYQFGSPGV